MTCKKCGAYVPEDSEYCMECGEPVSTENMDFDSEETSAEGEIKVPSLNKKRTEELHAIQERREQKRKREKRRKIIGICIAAALIAGAAGYGIYYVNENWGIEGTVIETPKPSGSPAVSPSVSPTADPSASPQVSAMPDNSAPPVQSGEETAAGSAAGGTQAAGTGNSKGTAGSTGTNVRSTSTQKPSQTGKPQANTSGGAKPGTGSSSQGSASTGAKPSKTESVSMGAAMSSQNIKGKRIAVDEATGKRLFVFSIGDTDYLANIDKWTTTEMVDGVYYTVSAKPSGEKYAGLPVYDITDIFKYKNYILPESDKRIISESEISGLSLQELALARNEIFARHGRTFKSSEYQRYFESKPWYKKNSSYNYDNDSANLNDVERKNLVTIIDCENKRK